MKKPLAILLCTALLMMTMTVCGTAPASAAQEPAGSPPSGAPAGGPPDGNGGPGGTWTLTGDSYITELNGDTAGINTNGYTLYVNGTALAA